jgi:hypothetical protein
MGWFCFFRCDIWRYGSKDKISRATKRIIFGAFGIGTLVFLWSSLLSKISEPD